MRKLKSFDLNEIQVCPVCHKIDVFLNDGHNCEAEEARRERMKNIMTKKCIVCCKKFKPVKSFHTICTDCWLKNITDDDIADFHDDAGDRD